MVLSCAALNSYEPMRLAGTWKQYSKKAMPQLARMTFQSASLRYFRWPYQAKVMKIFEMVSRRTVRIVGFVLGVNSNVQSPDGKYRFLRGYIKELIRRAWNLDVEGERDEVRTGGRRDGRHFRAIDWIVECVALDRDAACAANEAFE